MHKAFACLLLPGTPVPDHPCMAVMADASTKPCHFSSAGKAQQEAMPTTSNFFGELSSTVQADFDEGKISSAAQQRHAGGEGYHVGTACSSVLTCSRSSAAPRGKLDVYGAAGFNCAHAQPLRGTYMAMPTPEQHVFYEASCARTRLLKVALLYPACGIPL